MRISTIITSFLLVFIISSMGFSQTARESFTYPVGHSIDNMGSSSGGWGGPWMIDTSVSHAFYPDTQVVAADTGLGYADLDYDYANISNHLNITINGGDTYSGGRYMRALANAWPDVKGEYWISFLFEANAVPTTYTYYLVKLYSGSNERVGIGRGNGDNFYSCGSGWIAGESTDKSTTAVESNTPVFLVAKIVLSGDATADAAARTYMWINPDPSSTDLDTNSADVKRNTDLSTGFDKVAIEYGSQDTIQVAIDEIRLGTSYEDVTSDLVTPGHLAFESFNYPVNENGTIIGMGDAADGWADAWHLDPGDAGVSDSLYWVSNTGIDYGDMNYDVPHVGNLLYGSRGAAKYARYERTLDKVWTPDSGTVYWFSAIMELQNDTSSSTWAGIKLVQDHTDAAIMFGKGYGNDVYCINGYHGGPTDHPEEQTSYTWDTGPVWLVGQIFNRGLGNHYNTYMWVSPDPATAPDTSSADAKSYANTLQPGIAYVRVEYGGGVPFEMAVDEIRLGTVYSDIVSDVAREMFGKPTQFKLSQNYPNPFNPTTKIDYSIVKSGNVSLKVYNLLGQEVQTLFNGYQNVGNYQYTFDASKLASGVYFYRLQSGNSSLTKKMLLMK